jgi:hypothetical protein
MRNTKSFISAAALAAVALAPLAMGAREESKINLFMEEAEAGDALEARVGTGNALEAKAGAGNAKGMLRSDLAPGRATLRVEVNRLAPNLEHVLRGDGVEVARFTTNAAGNAELRIDLFQTGTDTTPSFDPRGKLLTIDDGTSDVLEAWVYGDPADDPPRPRIKEVTSLAREAATQGSVEARYDALPSGGARFWVTLRNVAPGDYDVIVDGAPVASLTTNPGGFAAIDLRIRPGAGGPPPNMNPRARHKFRGPLAINPRSKLIEVVDAQDVVHFAGEMLAQIPGLGVCTASSADAMLTAGAVQPTATGSVSLAVEESCDLHMTLTLASLAEAMYDLWIGGADVGDISIDATGAATLEYDDAPDAGAGELAMPAGVELGAAVPIEIRSGTDVVLSGTLP